MATALDLLPPERRPDPNTLRPAVREWLTRPVPDALLKTPQGRQAIASEIEKRLPRWTLMTTSVHGTQPDPISKAPEIVKGFAAGTMGAAEAVGATIEAAGRSGFVPGGIPGGGAVLEMAGSAIEAEHAPAAKFFRPRVPLGEVRKPGDVLPAAAWIVGQGVASTLPVIAAGMAGGLPGSLAAGYALNAGDVAKELDDLGVKSPKERARIALMMGVPVAALDRIVPGRVAERLAGRALGRAGTGVVARAARSAVSDATIESGTEMTQDAITHFGARAATGQPLEAAEGGKRMVEAAIAGGLTGGVLGGVSGAASARQEPGADIRSQALAEAARVRREALAAGKSEAQAMSEAKAAYSGALDRLTPPGAWWRPVREGPKGPESAAEVQESPTPPPTPPPAPAGAAAPTPAPTPAPTAAPPAAQAAPKPRPKDMVTLPGGTVGRILRVEASDKPGRATYVIQTEDGRTIRQTEKQLGAMEVTGRPDLEKSLANLRRQLAADPTAADVNRTRRRIATIEAILGVGQPPANPAAAKPSTTKPKEASSQVVAPSNLEGAREQKKVVRKPQKPAAAPASGVGPAPSERTVLPESPTPAASRTEAPVPRIVLEQMATTDEKKARATAIAIARQHPDANPVVLRRGTKFVVEINDPTHVKPAAAAKPAQPSARTNAPQATAPATRAPSAPKPPAAPEVRAARKAAMAAKKAGKSTEEQRAAAREAYNAAKPKEKPRRKLYRGTGRQDAASAYGEFATGPILGPGAYYAHTRADAEKYGPNIEESEDRLHNPLVLRTDDDFRKVFGRGSINPTTDAMSMAANEGLKGDKWNARVRELVAKRVAEMRRMAEAAGYDGVVVEIDDSRDSRRLREVFGHDQTIVFGAENQARAEAEGQSGGAAPPTPNVEARAESPAGAESGGAASAASGAPAPAPVAKRNLAGPEIDDEVNSLAEDYADARWMLSSSDPEMQRNGRSAMQLYEEAIRDLSASTGEADFWRGIDERIRAGKIVAMDAPTGHLKAAPEPKIVLGQPTPGIAIGDPDEAANVRGYKVGERLSVPYLGKSQKRGARNMSATYMRARFLNGKPWITAWVRVSPKTYREEEFPVERTKRYTKRDRSRALSNRIARADRKLGNLAELSGDKLQQMLDDLKARADRVRVGDGQESEDPRARTRWNALNDQITRVEQMLAARKAGENRYEYTNIAQALRDRYLSQGNKIYAGTAEFLHEQFGLHRVHEKHQEAILRAVSEYGFDSAEDANALVGGYFDVLRVVDQMDRLSREDMGEDGITFGMVEGPILGVYQDMRGRLDRAQAVVQKVRAELEGFGPDPTPEQQVALKALSEAAQADVAEGRDLVKQVDGKIKKAVTAKGRLADALEKVAKWIEDNTDPWGGGPATNFMGTGAIGQFIGAQIRRNVPAALRKMARRLGRNETEYRITDRHGNVQERGSVIPTEDWWADSAAARLMRGALGADIRLHPRMANLIRAYNAGAIADEQYVAQVIARVAGSAEAIRYLAEHGSGARQAMLALQGLSNHFDPRFKDALERARKVFDDLLDEDIQYAKERGIKPPKRRNKYAPHIKDGDPNTTTAQLYLLLEGKTEAEAATETLKDMEVRFWQEREGDAHYLLDFNRALRARISASLRKRRLDMLFDGVREYLQSEDVLTNRRGERERAEALKDVLRVLIFREKSRFEQHRDEGMRAILFNEMTKNADEIGLGDAERVLGMTKGQLEATGYKRVVFVRDTASRKNQSNAAWEPIGRSPKNDGAYYASKRSDMPFFTDALPQAKKWLERAIDLNTDKWKRLTGKLRDSEELRRHNGKVQQKIRNLYDNPFRVGVMMLTQGQSRGLLGYNVGFTTRNVGSGLAAIYSQHGFVPLAMGVARATRAAGNRMVRNFIVRLGDAGLLTPAQVERATKFAPVLRDEIYAEAAGINQGEFFELVQRLDDITEGRDERVMRVLRALDPRAMNRVAEGAIRTIAITAADYSATKLGAENRSRRHYRLWEGDRPGADVARDDVVRALNDPDSAEAHAVNGVMMSQFGYGVWGSEPVFLSRPGWRLLLQYALWPINNEAKFGIRPVTAAARYAKAAVGLGRPARNEGVRPRNRWEAWLDAHGAGYTTRKNAGRFMREMAIAGALMGLTDLTGVNVAVFRANLPFLAGMFMLRALFPDNETFKRWLQNQLWATGVSAARGSTIPFLPIGPAVSAANDIVRGAMSGASKAAKSGNIGDAVPWGATLEVVRRQLIAGDASIKKMLRAHPEEIERMGLSWMFDVFGVKRVQRGLEPGEKAKAVLGLQTAEDKNRRVREAR